MQRRGKVLIGLMMTMGLAAMDSTIVATAIPSVVRDLGGFTLFAWVFSIYVLMQAVTIPIYGKLADLFGRKPLLLIGTLIFLGGSALAGMSPNMLALIAFRGVQGIGAGAIMPLVSTLAGDLYDVRERARIQGWLSSVWGISAIIGPAIGGFFAEYASWRWIFYVNIPLGALAIGLIIAFLHEDVTHRAHRIDYAGAALLAGGTGLIIFAALEGGVGWAWLSAPSALVLGLAALLLGAFVWRERRAAEPIMPLWVFRRRVLVGANLATLALGLLSIGVTSFLPTYAQGVLGVDAVTAGFLLAAMSISWPIASALSGRLYLRIGFRDAALIGAGLAVAAGGIFLALGPGAPPVLAGLGSFVMGAGLGLLSTPLLVGIQTVVGWNRRGVVTGANMFGRQLGQAVGAAIFGSIVNVALFTWLQRAPAAIAGEVPADSNTVTQVLGGKGAGALSPAAAAYVRDGLATAMHLVFAAQVIIALASVIILLLTPRRFDPLPFAEDEPAPPQSLSAPPEVAPV
jgi:EmrB/QacA subfamily drug resistance transporter